MSNDKSKGTSAEGAGCPPQYIKLKQWIEAGIKDGSVTRSLIRKVLRVKLPNLFEVVRAGSGLDIEALYKLLGVKTVGVCVTCGDPTYMLRASCVGPLEHCGTVCSGKDRNLLSIKLASSRLTRGANRAARLLSVEDLSSEFPSVRRHILDAWKTPSGATDLGTLTLKKLLKSEHPRLYAYVKKGQGIDRRRLLLSMGLPLVGACPNCGEKKQKLPKRGLRINWVCRSCTTRLAYPKKRQDYLEKTGYAHSSHDPRVQEKMLLASTIRRKSFSAKKIIGRNDIFQSKHELVAVEHMQHDDSVRSIRTGVGVPRVMYSMSGISHSYLPDLGVTSVDGDYIIEVKSDWTLFLKNDHCWRKNYLKYRAANSKFDGCFLLAIPYKSTWYTIKDPALVMKEASALGVTREGFMQFLTTHHNSSVWFTKKRHYGAE